MPRKLLEHKREDGRRWYAENTARRKEINRKSYMKRKYNITPEQYQSMLAAQGGGCAICTTKPSAIHHRTLPVDHCHATGVVRGLLCDNCNRALGLLKDSPERILRLLAYVARYDQAYRHVAPQ